MRIIQLLIWCTALVVTVPAWGQEPVNPTVEQQLENLSEAEDSETEDDSYIQQLNSYRRQPLNLNTATESEFQPFRFLTDLQIQNFLAYRRLLGSLRSVYELQAIPAWDVETISRLMPFVRVGPAETVANDLRTRFTMGEQSILLRMTQVLERSQGYKSKNDTTPPAYPGSPQRLMVRYKYQYKNLLQFGLVGEKDPGEQFFKGAQKYGFDFYSFHLFVRNLGIVRQLAIGDFTVNFGQGLLSYQSLAFRKSVDVMNIKRQTEIFRPYNSAAEYNFQRGVAIRIGRKNWNLSAFASRQRITANEVAGVDTLDDEQIISSINTSGLHRTPNEVADRYNTTQTAFGARADYKIGRLHTAVNAVHYQLSTPLQRDDEPYNQFAFSGDRLTGFSGEMSYTWRNLHAFTEVAANPGKSGGLAMVGGLMASLDPRVDVSLLVRSMSKDYHTLYGKAFTEGTFPTNERGMYAGIAMRPWAQLRIDAYADFYSFPWLRFRVDRPSRGTDYVLQLTWKPNKQVEVYTRFKTESKAINYSNISLPWELTENIVRQNWRTHISMKVNTALTVRGRAEVMWHDYKGLQPEQGFLLFGDVFYKPLMSRYAFNGRLQYFETDGYNSRIYAFENDILYSFSIPGFYDKGWRYYANINYDITKKLTCWLRLSQTLFADNNSIGSGNDEIDSNHRTDLRLQFLYRW